MYVCRPPGTLDAFVLSSEDRSDPATGWDCFPALDAISSLQDLRSVIKVNKWLRSLTS